ncbi:hypothetical protein DP939_05850 [Spongiactinospora rosea]|uniref:PLD phosphodiesterase domain-containing protein n=1 Tax=Spongiactinospora rosea TaxID=2248750 RepID=A0A366M4T5_9ACTN|nr:AAA domain-containing protein [Spongiactinospora rosea]RBQ20614.1 hypothetical protein DP939_05850 [Spongiactinospora rosea]
MGWREEIATALDEWIAAEGGTGGKPRWRRLGRAIRTGDGLYVVDVRGTEPNPDRLDALRLAGAEQGSVSQGFPVMDVSQSESTLTVRVAEFADPADPHLWSMQQPPTFLVDALKEGLASLGSAPLGDMLAHRKPGGELSRTRPPAGLFPPQETAYQACLGTGVWLVWGPPGTGKTMVLKKAIGDLIAAGKRVLLVSATNIAVDNALLGVLDERRHPHGAIVRVGPPQLRKVAENADVSLPLLVRARLTATDDKRRDLSARLVVVRNRLRRLGELGTALAGFDAARFAQDEIFLGAPQHRPERCEAAVALHRTRLDSLADALAAAKLERDQASAAHAAMHPDRRLWAQVDELGAEAARVDQAATQAEAAALEAAHATAEAQRLMNDLETRSGLARLRAKRPLAAARQTRDAAMERELHLAERAASARDVADRRRADLVRQAEVLADSATHSRTELQEAEHRFTTASGEERRLTARGVRITVFLRDPSDRLQDRHLDLINQVRTVAHTVVSVNHMHQKIVVIDERTVMLGSLNALSQSRTREIMLTMRGAHFARRILEHEHAAEFSSPPACGRCGGSDIDVRRRKNGEWYWRCYARTCQVGSAGRAWHAPVDFGTRR